MKSNRIYRRNADARATTSMRQRSVVKTTIQKSGILNFVHVFAEKSKSVPPAFTSIKTRAGVNGKNRATSRGIKFISPYCIPLPLISCKLHA